MAERGYEPRMYVDPSTVSRITTLFRTTGDVAMQEPTSIQTSFEGRSLILAPNIRQEKRFFSVLVCFTGSVVYLAGRHVKKSGKLDLNSLRSAFLTPKSSYIPTNITESIHKAPDIFTYRPSSYRVVVQEKFQDRTFLQSPSNFAQRVFERCGYIVAAWFKCVGAFLSRILFLSD